MIHRERLLVLAFVPAALSAAASPDEPRRSLVAVRMDAGAQALSVDGRLDEAAWQSAPRATGFRQREPFEGKEATEDTEVRVLYDDKNLYFGILARDRDPDRIINRILQRDRVMRPDGFDQAHSFAGDDGVAILLDPFLDRRNAVVFATNPNGALFDALVTDEKAEFNDDWQGVWEVRAERVAQGWSAEFRIPFRTLRYPSSEAARAWGFNVLRVIRRRNEETLWSGWSREGGGLNRVSQAGTLEGLAGLPRSGLNLEMKPFSLAGLEQDREDPMQAATDARFDLGLDAKYEVRPGLVLDATANPDFAQVEADQQQVNLTRFDLFFPEKRDFFLENAGIFDFGFSGFDEPPPFLLFFSRRIGIADDEESEIPVKGGVRLTGRAGRQTVGLLDVYTGRGAGEAPANHGVLRVKRDVGRSNYVGGMLTDRRRGADSNTAGGVDASFWLGSGLNVQAFYARTSTSGDGGDDDVYHLGVDFSGDRFGFEAQHLTVGPEANAAMGFVTREDIRRNDAFGRLTLRPKMLGLRKIDVAGGGQYITNVEGEKRDWNLWPFVSFDWNSGDSLSFFYLEGFTRLEEEFDLSDRVPVPVGDYDYTLASIFFNTSANRKLVLNTRAEWQRNYGGHIDTLGATASVSLGRHLTTSLGYTRNDVALPGGAFLAHLGSLRLNWSFSTRLTAGAFVQYNSLDRELVANLRVGFIHRPGSDLFIVLNEERGGEEHQGGELARRTLAVKLTWLARF